MTCMEIERLITEGPVSRLPAEERKTVETHLQDCPACRTFAVRLAEIRESLPDLEWGPVPESLSRRTKQAALDVLRGEKRAVDHAGRKRAVPASIIAALGLMTVLTVIWITANLAGVDPGQALNDMPLAARIAVLLIAQNGLVLFFTPVILRAMRPEANGSPTFP